MPDQDDCVKCPLCEGHGELHRAELVEVLSDSNLLHKIESFLAALKRDPANGGNGHGSKHTFFQDVHTWNPKLPLWRRSPKE
jgi:hypothetical protein